MPGTPGYLAGGLFSPGGGSVVPTAPGRPAACVKRSLCVGHGTCITSLNYEHSLRQVLFLSALCCWETEPRTARPPARVVRSRDLMQRDSGLPWGTLASVQTLQIARPATANPGHPGNR